MTASYPTVSAENVGWIDTVQMIEVDRVMIEDLGINLFQMMENAGRNLARVALECFDTHKPVIAFGSGGNGGGGLVAARHLAVAGADVRIIKATDSELADVPAAQLAALAHMGVPEVDDVPTDADLVIDAVIGYSLRGAPRGRAAVVIDQIGKCAHPVLSLDTPSGLSTTTGVAEKPHVVADATLTLALPKVGLCTHDAVGRLFLADISVPGFVYDNMGAGPAPNFRDSPVVVVNR